VERAALRATPAVLPAGPPALQAWRPAPPLENRCGMSLNSEVEAHVAIILFGFNVLHCGNPTSPKLDL